MPHFVLQVLHSVLCILCYLEHLICVVLRREDGLAVCGVAVELDALWIGHVQELGVQCPKVYGKSLSS